MLKSKITLYCSTLSLLFLFILIFIRIQFINNNSNFNLNDTEFIGRINLIDKKKDYIKVGINVNGENLSGNLYNQKIHLKYNDLVKINGVLKEIEETDNFYAFSYKDYLKRHNQFFAIKINSIELIQKNSNAFYYIKNLIIQKIKTLDNSNYLYAFLLGDTSYIDSNVLESYRTNGISHLFAISGMHLSFFIGFLDKVLKRCNKSLKFIIISLFLLFYSFLVGFTPSVLRASFLYIFTKFTKSPLISLSMAFFIIILLNPYNFYEIGFQFSFLISFTLIVFSKKLKQISGVKQSILLSVITFIASIPLMILHFNQINIFTPIYNLFYIYFVSLFIFPLSFATFLIPYISNIYSLFINVLEKSSCFLSQLNISIWVMREPSILVFTILIISTVVVLYLIYSNKYKVIICFFVFLFFYHKINYLINEDYMTILNVGQGDSSLLYSDGETILVDTGGNFYTDVAKKVIIPYLKAKGISKIDKLILTHGDFDHMGSSISLVNNFKVDKVIFNNDKYNDLELKLIKILESKNVTYYKNVKELNIDDNKLYFLNTGLYDNENDNSNVIYTSINGNKILFMGDASIEVEEKILEKYNVSDIDILKVGHHGSDTSSSKGFVNKANPNISLISVGKNNRYGHPKDSVLDTLEDSKIYRTDKDGSIEIKLNKNGYKIKTYNTIERSKI